MAGLEDPLVEAGETAGERVLDVAAGKVLLEQADQEKAEQPHGSIADNVAAKEQAAVDDEKSGLQESQDEHRETDDAPGQASKEVREHSAVTEAVDGVGAALDLRHDPGDEKHDDEGNRLDDDPEQRGHFSAGLHAVRIGRVELMADAISTESKGGEHGDEDEQTPAGTEAVLADEDLAQG